MGKILTGVVIRIMKLFNYENLFVIIGAMISANQVNHHYPSTAIAERAMDQIPMKEK
jgi:hypothetical protein